MALETLRCSDASRARDEPLYGTASFVLRWLLIEQPGSWGRDALVQSGLPERVGRELRVKARAAGIRPILIRRGVRLSSERRKCYFARSQDGAVHLSEAEFGSVEDLLDVDMNAVAAEGLPDGEVLPGPIFLVCTHGRHDACCSIRGNQVSRIACADPELAAWECSHIGGDRFAANVVCLPHGTYYGRVEPHDVHELLENYRHGILSLGHYRGRSCYPFSVQACEYFARREGDITGVDALHLLESNATGNRVTASFALVDGRIAHVTLSVDASAEPVRLTCGATRPNAIPRYELEAVSFEAIRRENDTE